MANWPRATVRLVEVEVEPMEDVKDFERNVVDSRIQEGSEDTSLVDREQETCVDTSKTICLDEDGSGVRRQSVTSSGCSVKCEVVDEIAVTGSNIHTNKESNVSKESLARKVAKTYSRKEMEALRFVDTEAQYRIWTEVYLALTIDVRKEYDSLSPRDYQNQSSSNLDHRKHFRHKEGSHQGPRNEIKSSNAHTFEQEEYIEEYESDKDSGSIQRPAFFVTGEPDFESGPPEDGFEYLRRVRWETSQVPKVKIAKLERSKLKEQTVYMPKIPEIAKCPEHLLPNKQWEDAFLADFSELRLVLSRLDDSGTEVPGKLQLFPKEENIMKLLENNINVVQEDFENITTAEGSTNSETPDPKTQNLKPSGFAQSSPTLSAIMKMDCLGRVSMLRKRISLFENADALSRNDCVWLFALCAAVDTPLDADMSASVRSLLRKIASLRAEKVDMDDEVVMLNILATIAGRYFGQSEH